LTEQLQAAWTHFQVGTVEEFLVKVLVASASVLYTTTGSLTSLALLALPEDTFSLSHGVFVCIVLLFEEVRGCSGDSVTY
jgi:hypothetical protein